MGNYQVDGTDFNSFFFSLPWTFPSLQIQSLYVKIGAETYIFVGANLCVKIGARFPLAVDITSSLGLSIRMNSLLSVLG